MLSRLAIGRFIREAVDNMDTAINYTARAPQTSYSRLLSNEAPHPVDAISPSSSKATRIITDVKEIDSVDSTDDNGKLKSSTNKGMAPSSAAGEGAVTETVNRMNLMTDASTSDGTKSSAIRRVRSGTKMLIYSGHDSTMVPLLKAIGLYNGKIVRNCSSPPCQMLSTFMDLGVMFCQLSVFLLTSLNLPFPCIVLSRRLAPLRVLSHPRSSPTRLRGTGSAARCRGRAVRPCGVQRQGPSDGWVRWAAVVSIRHVPHTDSEDWADARWVSERMSQYWQLRSVQLAHVRV